MLKIETILLILSNTDVFVIFKFRSIYPRQIISFLVSANLTAPEVNMRGPCIF